MPDPTQHCRRLPSMDFASRMPTQLSRCYLKADLFLTQELGISAYQIAKALNTKERMGYS